MCPEANYSKVISYSRLIYLNCFNDIPMILRTIQQLIYKDRRTGPGHHGYCITDTGLLTQSFVFWSFAPTIVGTGRGPAALHQQIFRNVANLTDNGRTTG